MFSSSFEFSKVNHRKVCSGNITFIEHIYSFRGKVNHRYIVIVEEYDYNVFIVKFCLQNRKVHPDRFNQLTNLFECSRVLTTVGAIIKSIYDKNPFSSFGFIGSPLKDEKTENTKRFKLYSRVMMQVISPVLFTHYISTDKSAYLLVNKDNSEKELFQKIQKMFNEIYQIEWP